MESTESFIDVRDLLWKARQYKYHILLPILLVLCGAFLFYKMSVPVYESYVILNVGDRSNFSPGVDAMVRPDRDAAAPRDRIALLSSRIHSRGFLEALIDRTGLKQRVQASVKSGDHADLPANLSVSPEEYLLRLAFTSVGRRLSVTPAQGSMVRIAAVASNPIEARDLVSTTSDLLVQQSLQETLERVQARSVFSEDQVAVYQEQLRKAQEELRHYKESLLGRGLQTSVVDENNLDIARNLIGITEEESAQIRSRLLTERATWEAEMGAGAIPPDLGNESTSGMGRRLAELEVSLSTAVLGGVRSVNEAATLRSKVGELRQDLLTEYESLAADKVDGSAAARSAAAGISLDQALLRSLKAKSARLQGQVNAFTARVQSSPRDQMELQRLEGNVQAKEKMLQTLQQDVASSQITGAVASSELGVKLEVIEAAQVPLYPIFPNRIKIFGGALLLGPLLAIGLILALEKLGAVLQTVEQAEKEFGTRVIGTVPRIEGWGQPGSFFQNHWPAISIVVVLLLTGIFYTINTVLKPEAGPKPPAATQHQ